MVRARFKLTTLIWDNPEDHSQGAQLTFEACTSEVGNEDWSKWTPSGELTMHVTNPEAVKKFEGHIFEDFFLDFVRVS